MAYDDWTPEFRDVWNDIPGVPLFRDYEREISADLYERGWVDSTLTPDEREEARQEFFDFTGLEEQFFPWDEWREAMGYE